MTGGSRSAGVGDALLEVDGLRVVFETGRGAARAVDGVSFRVPRGGTLALVGESGSGKSVTALALLRLVSHPGRIEGGRLLFDGRDLLTLSEKEMRRIRGDRIAMVFQEPSSSLNPVFTAGSQIAEVLRLHRSLSRRAAREETIRLLREVGIPSPESRVDEYPHRMSGGMKQRVMIAMALACRPSLLVADEPTTALDVTIQAQILDLLRDLQRRHGMSILLITHDLGVVAEMADEVAVMYAGRVVESAPVGALFAAPRHPYTQGLFRSRPRLDRKLSRLEPIPGTVPSPLEFGPGCRFLPRCPIGDAACAEAIPPMAAVGARHAAACLKTGALS